mmetsp:Transcript_36423/g.84474  ORF Transcript_36423/g.84474 Transcript_36423/m.84474 type:complete len:209 (+) Transcript_36423:29-655(+)
MHKLYIYDRALTRINNLYIMTISKRLELVVERIHCWLGRGGESELGCDLRHPVLLLHAARAVHPVFLRQNAKPGRAHTPQLAKGGGVREGGGGERARHVPLACPGAVPCPGVVRLRLLLEQTVLRECPRSQRMRVEVLLGGPRVRAGQGVEAVVAEHAIARFVGGDYPHVRQRADAHLHACCLPLWRRLVSAIDLAELDRIRILADLY